ncbi:MAG: ACP S-malonyltransferase, partial [Candidatus Dormibacteraeota bacterium]|nr:ACP S-malonyltransferase [Candidatus Dormibacteraeota bacterium]
MSSRKLAFIYPGQGSQQPGMGADLLADPEIDQLCIRCSTDADLRHLLTSAGDDELRLTENAQPALCFMGIALTILLRRRGLEPVAVAGHSVGEYSALVAAGVIDPQDAIRLVTERGRAMAQAVPAGQTSMAAVLGLDPEAIVQAISGISECWPANYNTPTQTVIGGSLAALEQARGSLVDKGARKVLPLNVSAAFHTPFVAPAARRFRAVLDGITWGKPAIIVAANLTGAPYPPGTDFPDVLERQLQSPVRWSECVRALSESGATDFLEVGPGRALRRMLKELAPGAGAH